MAEFESEVGKNVFVACHHVVRALRASINNTDANLSKLLADLESHLSTMAVDTKRDIKGEVSGFNQITVRFKEAEKKILSWESNQTMIWDAGPDETDQYLQAVYEIQTILTGFKGLPVKANHEEKAVYNRATVVLDIAMLRLMKELCDVLDMNKLYVQPGRCMGVSIREEGITFEDSFSSLEEEDVREDSCRSERVGEAENAQLVDPLIIAHVKTIANAMFACGYGGEFCEAFVAVRKETLDEYLSMLETERFSCGDVLQMKWEDLNSKIQNWTRVLKTMIHVYLPSEKQLCEQILGGSESAYPFCFIEISKEIIFSLLNFGEAVTLGLLRPEKLERMLRMYDVSKEILLDVGNLFPDETGSFLRTAFYEVSKKLGDYTKATFLKFRDAVATYESSCPFPGGGIHHLTRYVMNYLQLLPKYTDSLNSLLKDLEQVDDSIGFVEQSGQDIPSLMFSPMARHLRSIVSQLEDSLLRKMKLYMDEPLRYIFLVNNIHYMVQKVKESELRNIFGDDWIRRHIARYQHHVTNYERATWSSLLYVLKDDDSTIVVRNRCRDFSLAFEKVHRKQVSWWVPDPQLREDLRISISLKVIQCYRCFLGRNAAHIGEMHVRYTCEDVENMLLEFFQGQGRTLQNSRRR